MEDIHRKTKKTNLNKQAEDPLKEPESLLISFFESPGPMRGIVETVDDTTVRHLLDNKAVASFIGVSQDEMRNKLSSELGEPPEIIRNWINAAKQSRKIGKPVTFEYTDDRDGHTAWLAGTVTTTGTTPEGNLRFIYVIHDITAHKENEKRLAFLSEKRQLLLNLSRIIVGERDLNPLLTKVAKSAQALTGSRIATCGHIPVDGTFTAGGAYWIEGESPCPPGESFQMRRGGVYMELIQGRDSIRLTQEELVNHPAWWGLPENHAPLRGLLGARLADENGQTNGVIMVSDKMNGEFTEEDEHFLRQLAIITSLALQHIEAHQEVEQKAAELESRVQARTAELQQAYNTIRQSQTQLQSLFENMAEGVILFDIQGKVLRINKAAGEILRIDPAMVEGTYYDSPYWKGKVTLPDGMMLSRENVEMFFQMSLHQAVKNAEVNVQLADGSQRWLRGSLAPLISESAQVNGIIITFADVTAEKELQKERERLSTRLLEIQEEERKRIAYELHDDTAQYLSILKMQIGALAGSKEIRSPKIKEKLQYLERDADRAFNDVRRYSHELRPAVLEKLGLVAALEQIADDYNKLGHLAVEVYVEGEEPELPEAVKVGFFRIAQEALNNTRKHAKASHFALNLKFNTSCLEMLASDDGIGFDVAEAGQQARNKGSLGLMSMQERARLIGANLKIDSSPGQGTTVKLEMPL